jgi:glycosyltransferase involved in cell wall biosynthesis
MLKSPKISIITPSYNSAAFIEQTIDSVLSQSFNNLEYIIIDGGSSDNTVNIIKKYDKHLAYWTTEPDQGQSHAINKGIRQSTGDVINWLNADDYYEQDALKVVSSAFENSQVLAYCARSRIFDESGTLKYSNGSDVYLNNLAKTIGMARIDQPETFFHRKAWQAVGLLNENLHYTMDKEWWIRFLLVFGIDKVYISKDLLVNFRYHNDSKTVSKQEEFLKEGFQLFLQLANDIKNNTFVNTVEKNFLVEYDKSYNIKFERGDPIIVKSALNYTLLYLADYLYYHSKYNEFKNIFLHIEKGLLLEEDFHKYNELKLRTNAILQKVRSLIRRK